MTKLEELKAKKEAAWDAYVAAYAELARLEQEVSRNE